MRLGIALLSSTLLWITPAVAKAPDVVVSIQPLHSLVAAVMDGVAAPRLLLQGNASPHTYTLKPSDARALKEAELMFVVGGGLEMFLEKPLATLGGAKVVAMADAPGVERLPLREGGLWEAHEHDHDSHDDHDDHDDHDHGEGEPFDNHLWLSPTNAKAFAAAAAEALAGIDPDGAAAYRRNAAATVAAIDSLDAELARSLEPARGKPYMVFHDAYHYFEDHYGLSPAGAITVSPERQPGAKRVAEIQENIRAGAAACVFREPQFSPKLVDRLAGPGVRVGVLDPIGAELPPGKAAWFELMRRLAESLRTCLAG